MAVGEHEHHDRETGAGDGRAAEVAVSVVVPTHDRAGLVLATIESARRQTRPPREIVVVDDGSTDDTEQRLAPLAADGRIRYVRQANAGLSAARNTGLAAATSDWVLFVDDDDLLLPDALERLAGEAARRPEAGMVAGGCVLFEQEPPTPADPAPDDWRPVEPGAFLVWNRLWSAGQVLIRRSALAEVGGFDVRVSPVADWDMWLRLLRHAPGRWTSRPTLAYRLHPGGMSRNVARMYEYSLRVATRHLALQPGDRRASFRAVSYARLRRWHAPQIRRQLGATLAAGDWRRAGHAARAWALAWGADLGARVALKAHLLRHGRFRLPADDPALRVEREHP